MNLWGVKKRHRLFRFLIWAFKTTFKPFLKSGTHRLVQPCFKVWWQSHLMANGAQSSEVVEITESAALIHRHNVISLPCIPWQHFLDQFRSCICWSPGTPLWGSKVELFLPQHFPIGSSSFYRPAFHPRSDLLPGKTCQVSMLKKRSLRSLTTTRRAPTLWANTAKLPYCT